MEKQKIVIGESSGAEYYIEKEIGRGGQGRVFSIKGGKYVFKLIGKKDSQNSQKLKNKISYLKTRPIAELPISIPLEQVKGKALGYIMEMATDMTPIEELIKPNGEFVKWWKKTGGLKRRLTLLKKTAQVISNLHSKGLVYGDFSLSNIFTSKNKNYSEVFFIDADNITHESKSGTAVYTPGYAAPEIIQTKTQAALSGYDTYTDNYSFAIIAYQLLTLNHPFIGDYVNNGKPELEEQAYLGKIPWVNHSTNNKNETSSGIPIELTISQEMMKSFQQTFELGINSKHKRTSIDKWIEILNTSLKMLLYCQNGNCNNYFFYNAKLTCPYCEEQINSIGVLGIYPDISRNKIKKTKSINMRILSPKKEIILTENDFLLNNSTKALFKIFYYKKSFHLKGVDLNKIYLFVDGKKNIVDVKEKIIINFKKEITIKLQNNVEYQRIIKLTKKRSS